MSPGGGLNKTKMAVTVGLGFSSKIFNKSYKFTSLFRYSSLATSEFDKPLSKNDDVRSEILNKNPRNLEQLRIGRKPRGWALEYPSRNYWNKLSFNEDHHCITGRVVHHSGKTLIKASSSELSIAKRLESTTNINAAVNVARVLAQRCLQAGILHVHVSVSENEQKREKVRLFLETLGKNGVGLKEPKQFFHTTMFNGR